MSVYTIDKNGIGGRLGALMGELDATFIRIQQYKAFLDTLTDATLLSPIGFVQADIDVMRSALNDVEQLRGIYQGSSTLATVKDFRTFAKATYAFGSV